MGGSSNELLHGPWLQFGGYIAMKLKYSEYRAVLDQMRTWAPGLHPSIAKLVGHINAITEELKAKEAEIRELKQLQLIFKELPKPYEPPVKPAWGGATLCDRIVDMVKNNETGTELWKSMLKYNNLTHEKAMEIYKKHKEGDGK